MCWALTFAQWCGQGGNCPLAETLPPSCPPKWNYTLYRGLWRAAILSPSLPPRSLVSPLAAPSFWKVWLRPCWFAHEWIHILRVRKNSIEKFTSQRRISVNKPLGIFFFFTLEHSFYNIFVFYPQKSRPKIYPSRQPDSSWTSPRRTRLHKSTNSTCKSRKWVIRKRDCY